MITLKDISFKYPQASTQLLENLNLTISGEIGGLMGANGMGKSTVLRLIMGLEIPQSGQVLLDGRPINTFTARKRAQKIAWLAPHSDLYFRFTVRDILEMARFPYDTPTAENREIIHSVAQETDCEPFLNRFYMDLSSGEQQRVDLARIFCQKTPILLLDEPFHHLDIAHKERCINLLKDRQQKHNLTILIVSHHTEILSELCTTLCALREGSLLYNGPTEQGLSETILQKTFY